MPNLTSKNTWFWNILPSPIFTQGVLFVVVYSNDLHDKTERQQKIAFNLQFERLIQSINSQLNANQQILHGVVGLFNSSSKVERREFRAYVESLELDEHYPGILGIGFSKYIEPKSLPSHIAALRKEGFADYQVHPAGQRDNYTSIIYLEPFNWRNQRALGFDMYSEPTRHKAMERAMFGKLAALSGKVTLVQETEKDIQAGVLLYVPIYQHPEHKQEHNFIGWAYSPLRMKDLMTSILDRNHPDFKDRIAVSIYDGPIVDDQSLLFQTQTTNIPNSQSLHLNRQIVLAGQTWTVCASTLPGFLDQEVSRETIVLVAGVFLTILLTAFARVLVQGHRRTVAAASLLSQFKAIVDSTGDAIISMTLDGMIISWNQGAEALFGYQAKEMLGKSIKLIIPPERENEEADILRQIAKGETVTSLETIRRHKDGRLIDISATIAPLRDAKANITGSSKIARDITSRKQQEIRLKESEERLSLATKHNGVGIWDWNLETLELIWDDSMFVLYQLQREAFSGAVDAWEKSLHPEDQQRAAQELDLAIAGIKPFDTEFRVIWPNHEIHYIKAVAEVLRDETGKPLRVLGTNIDITQRKIAEDKLRASEEQLRMVLEGAELGYWDWNILTGEVDRNENWATMLGYSYDEIQTTTQQWADFVHPDDKAKAWQSIFDVLNGRSAKHQLEYRMLHKDGGFRWIFDQAKIMQRSADGKPIRMSGTHTDITERKQAEIKLQLAAKVFMHAREGIIITDAKNNIIEVNETFSHITGYSKAEVLGQNPRIFHSGKQSPEFYEAMWQTINKSGYWSGEIWNRRKNGQVYAELMTISSILDLEKRTQYYIALFTDITSMKEHQQKLEYIAHYDPLTNLPNRVLLADRLHQAMIQCQRRSQSVVVAYLDLDGFKAVNDSQGHQVGDDLLIALSRRMKDTLRECDTLARIGGDEFVAVLADLENIADCQPILNRLLKAASDCVTVSDTVLQVSVSIGVTIFPDDNVDADQLMRHADQAMYAAKKAGKNCYRVFDLTLSDQSND